MLAACRKGQYSVFLNPQSGQGFGRLPFKSLDDVRLRENSVADIAEFTKYFISSGYIDKEKIVVMRSFCIDKDDNHGGGAIAIPKGWVTKIEYLQAAYSHST